GTNPSVKTVYIYDSNCFYFPLRLQNFFPDLQGIKIQSSQLTEVKRDDLKEYTNLRILNLFDNEIQFLESNLFEFVPKLELIWLDSNKIAHIDANVFNNFVGKLSHLYLSDNICQFENAHDDKSKANQIIEKVQSGFCINETLLPATIILAPTTTTAMPA
ncbi:leucine-rich repeat domain-containing protein, partial [Bacillus subtilis]|uniref:leucine-rich repeat domain-containing protein n=1 Tax=Bacillus subtilis TaxID=1423 RepID=UPI001BD144C8